MSKAKIYVHKATVLVEIELEIECETPKRPVVEHQIETLLRNRLDNDPSGDALVTLNPTEIEVLDLDLDENPIDGTEEQKS